MKGDAQLFLFCCGKQKCERFVNNHRGTHCFWFTNNIRSVGFLWWNSLRNTNRNYQHNTVIHSRTFVDPVTNARRNTVEWMWRLQSHHLNGNLECNPNCLTVIYVSLSGEKEWVLMLIPGKHKEDQLSLNMKKNLLFFKQFKIMSKHFMVKLPTSGPHENFKICFF